MTKSLYQTQFSDQGLAICQQIKNSGFLEELEAVLKTRLFETFLEDMDDIELRKLRDKLTAIQYVTNIIREDA